MARQFWLVLAVGVALFSVCNSAFGLDRMGPPTAGLRKGRLAAGLDFAISEMDLELEGHGVTDMLRDVEAQRYLVNLGYGMSDDWEVFLRLGVADTDAEGGFNGDTESTCGLGTKVTLAGDYDLKWGALFQIGWGKSKSYYSESIPGFFFPVSGDAEMDWYEVQAALGGNYDMDDYRLYSGVFLHYLRGDFDVASDTFPVTWEFDLREKSVLGAYIGAQFDIMKNTSLDTEFQVTADAWAVALGLAYRF
jgi:hypothetical protein